MNTLEEKIRGNIADLYKNNKVACLNNGMFMDDYISVYDFREALQIIATQAVEEERKRILDIEFRAPADKSDDWHAGIRYCLEKFRNTISKPNI